MRASDLLLTREDILAFFRTAGEALTEAQADAIMASTGGWPAAAALCVEAGGVTGEMDELLYRLFWARMEARQRTALLYLSLFDCVTPSVLDALLPVGVLPPEERDDFFRRVPLVRQDALRADIIPMSCCCAFSAHGWTRRRRRRGGASMGGPGSGIGTTTPPAPPWTAFRAGDDEGILSCRLVGLITERFRRRELHRAGRRGAAALPGGGAAAVSPVAAAAVLRAGHGGCDFGEFARQMARVRGLLREKQHLGEWELLDALEFFRILTGWTRPTHGRKR